MKLIQDWKSAWRWFSVQAGALIAIAPMLYEQTREMQGFMSYTVFNYVMTGLGVLVIIGRVIKQGKE